MPDGRVPVHGDPARGPGYRHARRASRVRSPDRTAVLGQRGCAESDSHQRAVQSPAGAGGSPDNEDSGRGERDVSHRHQAAINHGGHITEGTFVRKLLSRGVLLRPFSFRVRPN